MAADSTCSLKFGPEWIRVLSDSSAGQTLQPQPTQSTPPRKYPLAKHRYGKEELIAIYEQTLYGDSVPPLSMPGFVYCDGVYIELSQTPRSLIPMTDEEQRLWAFQRVASSRGRGRGITAAPWSAARSVGGHLQQTRNWRSPEKPMSSSVQSSAISASSQFNYWRKNSLNEDEKVPEWADERVSEDNEHVGSFDEKGGFLTLVNRARTVESVVSVSSSGSSLLQRSVSAATENESHIAQSTVGLETNVAKPLVEKPSSSPPLLQSVAERESNSSKRERLRDAHETNTIPSANSIPGAASVISNVAKSAARLDDSRSTLSQSKGAQVVILGNGNGTLESIPPTANVAVQESTSSVASERPIQQQSPSQWVNAPNRDISEAPLWYYKDPQGIIQGPFSSADMLEWSNQGYFHDSLECRRACDPDFNPLGALKKVWNGTLPFYMPNLHGPISSLLLHRQQLSTTPPSAVFSVSNVSMGLGVNSLDATQALNGFVTSTPSPVAVSSVSTISAITPGLRPETAYFDNTSTQFSTLSQHQNDFDGRNRQQQLPKDSDVGSDPIGIVRSPVSSCVQLEPDLQAASSLPESLLESSIRRSVHDHPFNQTVNNHMSATTGTMSNHRRGIISNRLIEHVNNAVPPLCTRTTTATNLEHQQQQQAADTSSWFNRAPSNSNLGYHGGDMISQSVNSVVGDQAAAHHRTITQHGVPNSWLVQRKNERNVEGSQRTSTLSEDTKLVAPSESSWNDFGYGDSTVVPPSPSVVVHDDGGDDSNPKYPQFTHRKHQEPLDREPEALDPSQQQLEQVASAEEIPFEKVVEKKKKKDRKEKERQREEKLQREKQERDDEQTKHVAQQNSTDEELDWDSGEQSAPGKMSSYQVDVIIPAPAPAIPAWGNTADKNMSALSLQEIQRLEEERASKERQQRQQEAVKNGYYAGIRTWANAIAPTKSFDQIQREQQASKVISGVQNKQQSKGTPAVSYAPMSAADVVANGIGGAPTNKSASSSSSKNAAKVFTAQVGRSNNNNNSNNSSPTTNNSHHTINNNGGEKPVVAVSETSNNEQQLIDWCAQITKGLNSYLDMPTVVSILKDVESEAEIEDYVSQFFGESLKEPRQFARQFVQKRAKFNVGLASSLPKQSEWCTTGGNKKRKGTKK